MQSSNGDSSALSGRLDQVTSRGPVQPAFLSNTTVFSYSFSKNKEHSCKKICSDAECSPRFSDHAFIFLNNQNSDAVGGGGFVYFFLRTMTFLSPLPTD